MIATCSSDKTIKIWNYEEKTLELNWSFTNEEPFALAFHPSGHYVKFIYIKTIFILII